MTQKRWISESLYNPIKFSFEVDNVDFEDKTDVQHLVVFDNSLFGRVMMLDGATQVTTKDEFIYHEMMVHVPLFALDAPKDVLIIGGGDGGIAREVLRHKSVSNCVQVEIDKTVVDFSLTHFPEISNGAYSHPNFKLIIADGMVYTAETQDRYDAIIVDSTDPQGPGAVLFTKEFYEHCKRCLKPGGVLVTQNGVPFLQPEELQSSVGHFRSLFNYGSCYVASIPTYIGGHMAMGWASDNAELANISKDVLQQRFAAANFDTNYYSPAVHASAFALPRFIEKLLVKV